MGCVPLASDSDHRRLVVHSTRLRMTLAIASAPTVVMLAARSVQGETLTPIDQQRSTSALVDFNLCGEPVSSSEAAPGFDPFESSVQAEVNCGKGWASVFADQQSQIGADLMTASGNAFLKTTGPEAGNLLTTAESFFEVSFELASACEFVLGGSISADFTSFADGMTIEAQATLIGPGKEPLVSEFVNGDPAGITFDTAGILTAGTYTLLVRVRISLDGRVPDNAVGDTGFDVTLQLRTIIGDVDGDGVVGIVDLLSLLADWGSCPPPPAPCPADLDGDGTVGILDFLLLLSNWS